MRDQFTIARENGEEDFLSPDNWEGLTKISNKAGCLIWGRKTYEKVITWDRKYLDVLQNVKKIIISHRTDLSTDPRFYCFVTTPKEALELLGSEGYKEVVLTGGSTNNSSFAKEGLIDEIVLNIEATIIGKGISLFNPDIFQLNLEFIGMEKINKDIIQLRYKVIKD